MEILLHCGTSAPPCTLTGDLERARALYTRVVTSSQHNAHAMFRLATVYHQQNRMEEAEQLYKQAMELDPTVRHGWCVVGSAAAGVSLAVSPQIPDLHNNLALLLLHTARIDDGRRVLDAGSLCIARAGVARNSSECVDPQDWRCIRTIPFWRRPAACSNELLRHGKHMVFAEKLEEMLLFPPSRQ